MTKGAGFSAAGFSPAGTGDIDTAPAPSKAILIDATNGSQQTTKKLNPATGQYVLNAAGGVQGMPRVRQLVLLRVKTALDSSAIAGMGLATVGGDRDGSTTRRITNNLQLALADLVTAKLITILSIDIASDTTTRVRGGVRWKDLTTQQEHLEPL